MFLNNRVLLLLWMVYGGWYMVDYQLSTINESSGNLKHSTKICLIGLISLFLLIRGTLNILHTW